MVVQNDTHELDTIHALATNLVGKPTEENLTEESADRGSDLETEVLVGCVGATLVVDVADHSCDDGDREDVVGIGEEADTCNGRQLVLCAKYQWGFKNNSPATMQALAWNQENLASSTSTRAARRRSPALAPAVGSAFSTSGDMMVEDEWMELLERTV
jgi:hypothetical protein